MDALVSLVAEAFMTKQSIIERAAETNRAALAIIEAEKRARSEKTERLKAARLQQPATD